MKPDPTNGDARAHAQTQARLRLLDLAEDASLYLRRSADPSVRIAAALLLATSLAACSPGSSGTGAEPPDLPAVPPLAEEVREGLPTAPGIYPVSPGSVTRDAQGVYGLTWRNPTGPATWTQGRASLMKLAQGLDDNLEIPPSGGPVLWLKPDTAITLPDDDGPVAGLTPTPGTSSGTSSSGTSSSGISSSGGSRSIAWYPFFTGGGTVPSGAVPSGGGVTGAVPATTPAFRNPPAAEPGQGTVRGASSTLVVPSTSARTWTSPSRAAATGQAGGPGLGTAASSRSGSLSGPASGAARPGSAGFSGGRSGGGVSVSSVG